MKLLVTGGAGFIGSNFIHYVLRTYPAYEVLNYDFLTYAGNLANLESVENDPRYSFIQGDVADRESVYEAVRGVDAIVHFAAESHVDRSIESSELFIKTNILGTAILLDAVREYAIPRFHQVSTDEVFGQLGDSGTFNEKTPYAPRNPYAASKAAADHIVRSYFHTYKLPVTISNCSNNFGPRQFPEKFISLAITNLMQGKKIPVYGKGSNIRDWLYVDDHCRAIDLVLHKGTPGETYCVGGGTEMKNIDIAKLITEHFGAGEDMIEFVADRKGHDYRYAIDASRIRQELGWSPQNNFKQQLRDTVDWYRQNERWWRDILSGAYRTLRVPPRKGAA